MKRRFLLFTFLKSQLSVLVIRDSNEAGGTKTQLKLIKSHTLLCLSRGGECPDRQTDRDGEHYSLENVQAQGTRSQQEWVSGPLGRWQERLPYPTCLHSSQRSAALHPYWKANISCCILRVLGKEVARVSRGQELGHTETLVRVQMTHKLIL